MQKQLETTSIALQQNPYPVVQTFQAILSRPSYFQAHADAGHWTVLLGPSISTPVIEPAAVTTGLNVTSALPRTFDFVAWQPSLALRTARRIKRMAVAFHLWLMHPVIDTRTERQPSEPAG